MALLISQHEPIQHFYCSNQINSLLLVSGFGVASVLFKKVSAWMTSWQQVKVLWRGADKRQMVWLIVFMPHVFVLNSGPGPSITGACLFCLEVWVRCMWAELLFFASCGCSTLFPLEPVKSAPLTFDSWGNLPRFHCAVLLVFKMNENLPKKKK